MTTLKCILLLLFVGVSVLLAIAFDSYNLGTIGFVILIVASGIFTLIGAIVDN